MKKILLTLFLAVSLGFFNKSQAQCSGGSVTIANFVLLPALQQVIYSFDWQYIQGNASIEVVFKCNGVQIGSLPCIPRLKDSAAGFHNVSGTFSTTCSGTFRMEIRIWTNPTCGGTFCVADFREITNIPLPVKFSFFTASRTSANAVKLAWQTTSEINNSGFEVQRNTTGTWETAAFIPTLAPGGNSDQVLNYSYTDLNTAKGMSQYRIKQIDFDGKAEYSSIRAVRGEAVSVKTVVYPNPSPDGRVNVVFDDMNGTRDVTLMDLQGRIIRNWKGVANNHLAIDNLNPGIYSLRITVRETGAQTVEKLVVKKQ
jgi:hypothetical protein